MHKKSWIRTSKNESKSSKNSFHLWAMAQKGHGELRILQKRLAEYEAEFRKQKHRLNCEEVSTGEEKKIMRNIKILENNIAEVKKYMSKNVEEVFVKKTQKQKKVR
eukprot:UN03364